MSEAGTSEMDPMPKNFDIAPAVENAPEVEALIGDRVEFELDGILYRGQVTNIVPGVVGDILRPAAAYVAIVGMSDTLTVPRSTLTVLSKYAPLVELSGHAQLVMAEQTYATERDSLRQERDELVGDLDEAREDVLTLARIISRLSTENGATAAALKATGMGGIMDEFRDPADAITQMAQHIRLLEEQAGLPAGTEKAL